MNGNRFALSDSVFGPGLIVLTEDGTFYYIQEDVNIDETRESRKSNGYVEVEFEDLVKELIESDIEPKGPELATELKEYDDSNWDAYQKMCKDIGQAVFRHVSSDGADSFQNKR